MKTNRCNEGYRRLNGKNGSRKRENKKCQRWDPHEIKNPNKRQNDDDFGAGFCGVRENTNQEYCMING